MRLNEISRSKLEREFDNYISSSDDSKVSDEVWAFIYDLVPTDIGVDVIDGFLICYEGFHEECNDDVDRRMNLDKNDIEYVCSYDEVYAQVFQEFDSKAGKRGFYYDILDYEDHSILIAVYEDVSKERLPY